MSQAFLIALGEGLEGLLIVAIILGFLRHTGRRSLVPAVYWGLGLSVVVSIAVAMAFERAANQALWEGLMAVACAVLVAWLAVETRNAVSRHREQRSLRQPPIEAPSATAFAGVLLFTLILITREGMEFVVLISTLLFQIKSPSVIAAALAGVLCAAAIAAMWARYGERLSLWSFFGAAGVFLIAFLANLIVYGFHELAEARLLPYSGALHTATEPYSPDGYYGKYFPYLIAVLPLIWLAVRSGFVEERERVG